MARTPVSRPSSRGSGSTSRRATPRSRRAASSHEPVRTCVGCRQEAGKRALVRVVRLPAGGTAIDASGRTNGRGAYLHADQSCIERAIKRRALERALSAAVSEDTWAALRAMA